MGFFSVLRVTSGPRMKLAGRKSALTTPRSPPSPRTPPPPPVVYSTDRSKAVVPVLVLLFVAFWFILWGGFLCLALCNFVLVFSVLLALQLLRFSYVCSICACLVLSGSSSSWCLGRAAVRDCGAPWTFSYLF